MRGLICLLLLLVSPLYGATFNLNPVADAFISAAHPDANYGGAGALAISASGAAKGEFQSLLRFDTTAAKASFDATFGAGQWIVDSLTLQLTAAYPNNPVFNSSSAGQFSASWMSSDSWTEGSGTPSAPGSTGISFSTLSQFVGAGDQALGTFDFDGATSGGVSVNLAVLPGIRDDLESANSASLRLFASDAQVSALFNSRSFGNQTARPVLIVSAVEVPEPATLLGLAIAACVIIRARKP